MQDSKPSVYHNPISANSIILLITISFFLYCTLHLTAHESRGIKILEVEKNGKRIILYENSYALLIGVSDYKHWPDLNSVPTEMNLLESALKKHGFIIEKYLDPNSEVLKKTIENFINKYGFEVNNRLLIFFSGHGYSRKDGRKGYIVPSDAVKPLNDQEEIRFVQKAIEMDQILTWARRIEAKHALFVFDSCFSGTVFKSKSTSTPAYISYLTGKPIRQFITAGSAGETVPAKSSFVPCFIRGIEGEADAYRDGYITATELGLFLQRKIKTYKIGQTPQYGKIRDPELDQGDFVFITDTAPSPPPLILEFESIEYAEINENKIFVFDVRGNKLIKRFDSQIMCYAIDDIDQDGNNDIVVGFAGEGKQRNQIIALHILNNELKKKWHYMKDPFHPYPGEKNKVFNVMDVKVFQEGNQKIIAASFAHRPWYQCALTILNPQGKKLKEFWHSGRMYQIEKLKDVFIIRALNNDLHLPGISKLPGKHLHVIFGLTYEHIYGQSPRTMEIRKKTPISGGIISCLTRKKVS